MRFSDSIITLILFSGQVIATRWKTKRGWEFMPSPDLLLAVPELTTILHRRILYISVEFELGYILVIVNVASNQSQIISNGGCGNQQIKGSLGNRALEAA